MYPPSAICPLGRPPLITRWTTWENGTKLWKFVDEKIEEGQQAYVVCPIIEPSENMPQLALDRTGLDALSKTFLPHRRVEILHGRHSTEVKTDLMSRMRGGRCGCGCGDNRDRSRCGSS